MTTATKVKKKDQSPDPAAGLMTTREACVYLGAYTEAEIEQLSNALRHLIRQGRLQAKKFGDRYLLSREALDDVTFHSVGRRRRRENPQENDE